jgi:hypothetical protein
MMLLLKGELDQKREPTLFLNFDVEWDRVHLESQAALSPYGIHELRRISSGCFGREAG